MKIDHRLLSTKELARILNISHRTLENMRLRERGPPYLRIGRVIRYEMNEVLKWMEQGIVRVA